MNRNTNEKQNRRIAKAILRVFRKSNAQKLNYKQISSKLLMHSHQERKMVLTVLKKLEMDGLIKEEERGKYVAVKRNKVTWDGVIEITKSGSGYVTTDLFPKDVFIPRRNTGGAMNSDEVRIEIDPNKKQVEGRVIGIIKRSRDTFVGTVEAGKEHMFVIPDDFRLNLDFYVPSDKSIGARDGDKVIVKVLDWPEGAKNPFAKIIEILGKSGEHEVEMHAIMHEFGLPLDFSNAVKKSASAMAEGITKEEIAQRLDLRSRKTFTIDPVDAKDFDDALSVHRVNDDHLEIGVHIADVSHYVTPGSIIDKEARERSTSVYLVDRVVPMLPEILSNVICSLRPNEDKLTFSVLFTFNSKGEIKKVWIGKTIIHSDYRFTYEEAQQILDQEKGKYLNELNTLNDLAKILRGKRFDHGSIDFGGSEVRFKLDAKGFPIGIQKKVMQDTNQLVEEFMLLANKKVSESIGRIKKGQPIKPFVYRIHDTPDETKLDLLSAFADKFGYTMKRIKEKGAATAINRLIKASEGQPEEEVIKTMAIRSMAKAVYSVHNIGHYGLAFDHYSHFTSPIRRYPDLEVHRLLSGYASNQPYSNSIELEKMCKHASENEKRATDAERASIKYKQVEYMSQFIGKEFVGMISGITNWGIYVEVMEGLCEGMIALNTLQDDQYYFDDKNFVIKGSLHGHEYTIGDKVGVIVLRTDTYRRLIDFKMVE